MSYSEIVEEMWKKYLDGKHHYRYQAFDLPVKNEHLKSYHVKLLLELETSRNCCDIRYRIDKNNTQFGVYGRSNGCFKANFIDGKFPDIDQKIEALINEVESLVFDKWIGSFVNMKCEYNTIRLNFRKLLLQNAKEVPVCSVCLDACNTTTKCGHTLCVECYHKLPTGKKCPICRARLFRKVEYHGN